MRRRNRDEKNSEKVDLKKELKAAKQMVLEKDDKLNQMDAQLEKKRRKYEYEKNENNDKWRKQVYTKLNSDKKTPVQRSIYHCGP